MHKSAIKPFVIFWLFLLPLQLFAGGKEFSFSYLTAEDGLTSNGVICVYRDSKDYVWIGTNNGLNRYDGTNIFTYKNQAGNSQSISNNYINHIAEDAFGNIWVGTGNGVNLYSRDFDNFKNFKYNPSDKTSISGNHITHIFCDRDSNLWVAARGVDGLNKWLPESESFKRYHIEGTSNDGLANTTECIIQDKNGVLWLGGHCNEIISFDPEKSKFTAHSQSGIDLSGAANKLMVDSDNTIWICNRKNGLFSYNPAENKFTAFSSNGDGTGTNRKIIFSAIQEDENHILFAIDEGGINRYHKVTKKFDYTIRLEGQPNTLNNNGLWCIYQDKEGILWVGTSGGGMNVNNPKTKKFKLYRHNEKDPNSLAYHLVSGIFEDSKGLIWVTTNGGGLSIYNPKNGQFTNYKNDPNNPRSLPCNVLRSTIEDKYGNYWLGTWDGGLIKYNSTSGHFSNFLPGGQSGFNISGRNVWHLLIDHTGLMWATIFEEGIDLIDLKKGVIKKFKGNPYKPGALSSTRPQYIFQDSRKLIYVCSDGGLNRYDSLTQSFYPIAFPNNSVNIVFEDAEGGMWAGTQDGLYRFETSGKIIKSYGINDGLPNSNIIGILEDDHQNLWLSTNNGLSRLNYKTSKIRNYSTDDGLQGRQFEIHSCFKTKSGELFFGGFKGMNSFYPDSLKDNDYLPPVYINEFQLFNKTMEPGMPNSPLKKRIERTTSIELSYKQSVFSFGFMAINYTNSQKNNYEYKMVGYDTEWIPANASRRYATYTNLAPGDYTFMVRASNNDGIWNPTPTSISIHITPPFWGTLWFRTIIALLLIGAFVLFIYVRELNLVQQKKALALKVEERTAELQNSNSLLKESHQQIKIQNDEIQDQHDEILTQKMSLQEQNERLELAYKELSTYELQLEAIVEERTKELVAAKIKAEESDLLKSSFLANMSHEIRTPLNAIVGFTDLLVNYPSDDETKLQFKTILNSNTNALLNLINDILDLSKIESGQLVINKASTNLGHLLNEINEVHALECEQMRANNNKNIEFRVIADDRLKEANILTDKARVMQIIHNLVNNAIKFTHDGFVEVRCEMSDNGQFVNISVQDTGIGIKEESQKLIFERFIKIETTNTTLYRGTGLGLSICKHLAKLLNGSLTLTSEPNVGSTFMLAIPFDGNVAAHDPTTANLKNKEILDLTSKTILLVEDDASNTLFLTTYLTKTGAKVLHAMNGVEALDFLDTNNNIDLILMDLQMPVMDGYTAIEEIRKRYDGVPVIAQTSYAFANELNKLLALGFNDLITKPILTNNLTAVLNKYLVV